MGGEPGAGHHAERSSGSSSFLSSTSCTNSSSLASSGRPGRKDSRSCSSYTSFRSCLSYQRPTLPWFRYKLLEPRQQMLVLEDLLLVAMELLLPFVHMAFAVRGSFCRGVQSVETAFALGKLPDHVLSKFPCRAYLLGQLAYLLRDGYCFRMWWDSQPLDLVLRVTLCSQWALVGLCVLTPGLYIRPGVRSFVWVFTRLALGVANVASAVTLSHAALQLTSSFYYTSVHYWSGLWFVSWRAVLSSGGRVPFCIQRFVGIAECLLHCVAITVLQHKLKQTRWTALGLINCCILAYALPTAVVYASERGGVIPQLQKCCWDAASALLRGKRGLGGRRTATKARLFEGEGRQESSPTFDMPATRGAAMDVEYLRDLYIIHTDHPQRLCEAWNKHLSSRQLVHSSSDSLYYKTCVERPSSMARQSLLSLKSLEVQVGTSWKHGADLDARQAVANYLQYLEPNIQLKGCDNM